jgi:broad specificity phosphatase PhoE
MTTPPGRQPAHNPADNPSTGPTTTVHFLRHGEVFNPDKILYGRLPGFRLSDSGAEMAEQAAQWFAGRDVSHVVSSPLQRALETAAPVAARLRLQVTVDDRLTEAGNAFEGRRVVGSGGVLKYPRSWPLFRDPFRPSWGEPYVQVAQRMFAAALSARDRAEGREAVCVSHQMPIVCLRRYAEGRRLWHDPRHRQCSLASVTSLIFRGDTVVRVDYAEPAGRSSNLLSRQPPGA